LGGVGDIALIKRAYYDEKAGFDEKDKHRVVWVWKTGSHIEKRSQWTEYSFEKSFKKIDAHVAEGIILIKSI
jgi:hypothetical protein